LDTSCRACSGVVLALMLVLPHAAAAQAQPPSAQALRAGASLMPTQVYTQEDDERVLAFFKGLRVADVTDGMDAVGLQNVGLMDPAIRPLWTDTQRFAHRIIGVAVTARYVPTNRPAAGRMETEQYDQWAGRWYTELSSEPFADVLRRGSVLVIDDAPEADVGSIGSNNIMIWKSRGMVGVVTDATARDTDEIALQRVPLYFRGPGRGIRPGRNEIESVNRPVVCGGVLVMPGDVIDGDGVVVVPRAHAEAVARYAHAVIEKDKAARRTLYEQLGMPEDDSVK
jgi:4-hydroxy-4-methyl-2-oxoglutarate aldolase